jgi:hypothetical protein
MDINMDIKSELDIKNIPPIIQNNIIKGYSIILLLFFMLKCRLALLCVNLKESSVIKLLFISLFTLLMFSWNEDIDKINIEIINKNKLNTNVLLLHLNNPAYKDIPLDKKLILRFMYANIQV